MISALVALPANATGSVSEGTPATDRSCFPTRNELHVPVELGDCHVEASSSADGTVSLTARASTLRNGEAPGLMRALSSGGSDFDLTLERPAQVIEVRVRGSIAEASVVGSDLAIARLFLTTDLESPCEGSCSGGRAIDPTQPAFDVVLRIEGEIPPGSYPLRVRVEASATTYLGSASVVFSGTISSIKITVT